MELTAQDLWARIQEISKASLPERSYRTWISGARAVGLTSQELVVEVPSPFHVEWLEVKFATLLEAAAERVVGRPLKLTVRAAPEGARSSGEDGAPAATQPGAEAIAAASTTAALERGARADVPAPRPPRPRPALNDRYTFDRFVVGSHSQLAAAAAKAVGQRPAKLYNPLFLYGGVGLGKTHLMHAIGHEVVGSGSDLHVCYVSAEQFTNELVMSIQEGTMPAFRRKYRQMELLLMDDIHFLEGKERTQEEFFHTFNALYDAQRQIVLTSDRPPKEIPGLEERLVSRFEWGLVVDIKPPDYETRVAILRKKAAFDGLSLDEEVIDFIARSCTSSVRELEGAVIKLLAYSSLTRKEITLDLARSALNSMMGRRRDDGPVMSPERIRETVARRWRVRADALASKRRTKDLTVPRQVAMYLIKETLGTSLVRIGELFGGRDHSTVIHSIRKIERELEHDPELRSQIQAIREELESAGDGPVHN